MKGGAYWLKLVNHQTNNPTIPDISVFAQTFILLILFFFVAVQGKIIAADSKDQRCAVLEFLCLTTIIIIAAIYPTNATQPRQEL